MQQKQGTEKLGVKSETGNTLSTQIFYPSRTSTKTVIVCHGLNGRKDAPKNIERTQALLKQGYNVILFDFSSHGESTGNMEDTTLSLWLKDLEAIIRLAESKGSKNIALFGHSLGGTVSIIYALKNPGKIKALATTAAPTILSNKGSLLRVLNAWNQGIAEKFSQDIAQNSYDLIPKAPKLSTPLLLMHGTEDELIDSEEARTLYYETGSDKKLVFFEEVGHGLAHKEEQALEEAIEWFKKHL